jgi:hypothetical protein
VCSSDLEAPPSQPSWAAVEDRLVKATN